jgi:hypothetical protein
MTEKPKDDDAIHTEGTGEHSHFQGTKVNNDDNYIIDKD